MGALTIAFFAIPTWFPRIYTSGSILFLTVIVLFSLSPWYELCLALLLVGGVAIAAFASMQSAIIFSATHPSVRRRVMGVLVVCIGTGPLGVLHTGLLATWLSADTTIRIIAIEGLATMSLCIWLWPELWRSGTHFFSHKRPLNKP